MRLAGWIRLASSNWLVTGDWWLGIGGWGLLAGDCWLETGGWRPVAVGWWLVAREQGLGWLVGWKWASWLSGCLPA